MGRVLTDVKILDMKRYEHKRQENRKYKGTKIGACFVYLKEREVGGDVREMSMGHTVKIL